MKATESTEMQIEDPSSKSVKPEKQRDKDFRCFGFVIVLLFEHFSYFGNEERVAIITRVRAVVKRKRRRRLSCPYSCGKTNTRRKHSCDIEDSY